ncbi:MAG: hypothetical protein LUG16_08550, partial [Candidatus Gastranaerophilales bacterium]|nr:hypothetical protein [Candidatus Gastranaerophilales bacterium]
DKEIYNELMLDDDEKNSKKMAQEHNDAREKELQNKYQNPKLTKSQILKEYIEKYKRLFEVTNIFPKYLKLLKLFKKSGISDSTLKSNEILQNIMAGVYKENSLKFWHIDMFEYSNSNAKSFEFKGLFIELYNKNLCYKYSNEGFLIISQNSPASNNKNIIDKNMKKFYKNYNIVFSNDRISPELVMLLNNLANQKIKVSVSYEMGNINIMLEAKFKKLYGIALYKSLNNPKSYNSVIKEIYKIFRIIDSFIEIC